MIAGKSIKLFFVDGDAPMMMEDLPRLTGGLRADLLSGEVRVGATAITQMVVP